MAAAAICIAPMIRWALSMSGDYLRKNLFLADRLDYRIDPFNFSEWVNYTRDWPNSTNWVIARLSTDVGLSGTLTLSKVNLTPPRTWAPSRLPAATAGALLTTSI